jgi:hypothetical protein
MPLPSPSQCCPQALDIITFFLYDGGDASTLEAGEERVVRPILFDLSKSYFSSSKDERERKNYDQQPTLRQAVPFVLDQGTMDAAFELNDSLNPDLILSPYDAIFLEHGEGKDFRVGLLCGPAFGDFLFTNYSPRDHLRIDPWFQHKGEACPMPYTLFLGRDETPCYIEVNADEAIRQGFKFKNDYSKFNAGKVQRQLATPEWTKKLRELVFGEEFVRTTPWINRIGVVANEAAFDPRFNKIWSLKGFPTILVTLLSALVIMGRCRLSKRNVEPQGYWLNKRNQPKSHQGSAEGQGPRQRGQGARGQVPLEDHQEGQARRVSGQDQVLRQGRLRDREGHPRRLQDLPRGEGVPLNPGPRLDPQELLEGLGLLLPPGPGQALEQGLVNHQQDRWQVLWGEVVGKHADQLPL